MFDISILLAIAGVLIVIIFALRYFLKPTEKSNGSEVERPRAADNSLRNPISRRAQLARNRGLRLRENFNNQPINEVNEGIDDRQATPTALDLPEGKMGTKKRAKLTAKAEKKAAREAEEQQRAEKKKRLELEDAERKKVEEKEKAEEKEREEAEKKAKEEQERKDYEEYLKIKEGFLVEEEGFEEDDEDSLKNLLQDFINYIKENKVVIIEDLAAHFKLKTQACIDRIKDLQQDNILTGVIDDRGKFIYVSQTEIENVAKFIKQRGRVSISELAEHSNKLISLVSVK